MGDDVPMKVVASGAVDRPTIELAVAQVPEVHHMGNSAIARGNTDAALAFGRTAPDSCACSMNIATLVTPAPGFPAFRQRSSWS